MCVKGELRLWKDTAAMILRRWRMRPLLWIILAGLLFGTPLVTKLVPADLTALEASLYGFGRYNDLFMHFKSLYFVALTAIAAACMVILKVRRQGFRLRGSGVLFWILGTVIFLSALFSPYFPTPLTGVPERYESIWVHLGYLCVFLMTAEMVREEEDAAVVEWILTMQLALIGLVCAGQYYGFNLLNWDPVRTLLTNPDVARVNPVIALETKAVYGTLGNPGNLGQYCSFMIPLLICRQLHKGAASRGVMAALCLGWFCVFASGTGSAILGAGIGVLLGVWLLIFRGGTVSWSIITIPLLTGLVLTLPGLEFPINWENTALLALVLGTGALLKKGVPWLNGIFRTRPHAIAAVMIGISLAVLLMILIPVFPREGFIREMDIQQGQLRIITQEGAHVVERSGEGLWFTTSSGAKIPTTITDGRISSRDPSIQGLEYSVKPDGVGALLTMHRTGMVFRFEEDSLEMLDQKGSSIVLENPPVLGFNGMESRFSCRGYIWSRSLPLLFVHPLLGVGSDAFVFAFPQGDYPGKFNMFGTPYMLIDKPHSFYLQYGIQQGIPALFILLWIILQSGISGVRNALRKEELFWKYPYVAALGGFLVAAVFNDSLVTTTMFLWLALGILYPVSSGMKKV